MSGNTGAGKADAYEYIAYICCRQRKLDREAAEMIRKRIENFIIPKQLRRDPEVKKLGKVFCHEDELPLSADLPERIVRALDHSEYLIVLCSPHLSESVWCKEEVHHFRQAHGSDHILLVLIDGEPRESFPDYLLYAYDENGNVVGMCEPLAAVISGPDHSINRKEFSRETARLLAPMLNSTANEIWQMERQASNRIGSFLSSLFEKKEAPAAGGSAPSTDNILSFSFSRPNQAIRFYQGDLTDTGQDYDVIVCSTYKGMYDPALFSLIGALEAKKNISVRELSKDPELDMREMGGWLSRPVNEQFRQLLCVELTAFPSSAEDRQADHTAVLKSAFLTLRNLLERASVQGKVIRRIALPVLGAGYQQIDTEYIAPPLFTQCVNMLKTIPTLETIDFYEIDPSRYRRLVEICNELAASDTEKAPDLFISYSTAQADYAHKVQSGLRENGISAWIAPESIPTGSSYIAEIPRAISSVRAILLLLTMEAQSSRWVQKEVGSAIGAGKLLLPMKLSSFALTPEMSFLLEGEQFCPIWQEDEAEQIPAIIREAQSKLQA